MKRIAIIDDDDIFQLTTKAKLKKLGLAEDIQVFNDGEQAFEFLRYAEHEELPDVLLLDINMPIVDGWDFIEMFKTFPDERRNKMKVYMLSSSINPIDIERAKEENEILHYLTKPISDDDLIGLFK